MKIYWILPWLFGFLLTACNSNKKKTTGDMPGMDMPKTEIKEGADTAAVKDVASLENLLQPTDQFVVASLPATTMQQSDEQMELSALGTVSYDNRQIGMISSRIAGRIEKLYLRYRYQHVNKGQKVLDLYSPELLTSQQNLIFVTRSDPNNTALINAAKQRLLLLGMSEQQIAHILRTGKPLYSVSVYSDYSGYVTEMGFDSNMGNNLDERTNNSMQVGNENPMASVSLTTVELPIKEGTYVEKGQQIFTVINANKALVYLSIFSDQQNLIKKGTPVMIVPETAPENKFRATIDWMEPFYRPGSKTLSARVYFNNASLKLPIGSPVKATVFAGAQFAHWLPASAVISMGLNSVVFKKEARGFRAHAVTTGIRTTNMVQIISGLSAADSVAVNAQYLVGSESTLNTKQ